MKPIIKGSLMVAALALWAGAAAASDGDAAAGEKVFKKCKSCHMMGEGAKNRAGPPLNDLMGRVAGTFEGFRFAKAIKARGEEGLTWTVENLDAFLANPKGFMPGTRMSFVGLKKEADRANVIAYLATFSGAGATQAVEDDGFKVSPEILAIKGDKDWGEYLSSECTTCHQVSGADKGIPSITGWDAEAFVTAMHAYREKHREHPVMQMVAGRLSDDEIAGLAVYFQSLGQ